jgi:hypothetical protein
MSTFEYETEPLGKKETVIAVYYGGRGQRGQQYVVTNRRLLMGPLDTGMAKGIDAYVLNLAMPGAGAGDLMKDILSRRSPARPKTLSLRDVVDVRATNNAGWFKAPGLRITTSTDQIFKLDIVATPTTMNRDPSNNAVRDDAVQVIQAAVEVAKSAPSAAV